MANGLVSPGVTCRKIIGFPNPVNEKAARTVAGGVLLLSCLTFALSVTAGDAWLWLAAPISLGFIARVLTGPKLSPLGQFATRVVAPHLGPPKLVAGPPKRLRGLQQHLPARRLIRSTSLNPPRRSAWRLTQEGEPDGSPA